MIKVGFKRLTNDAILPVKAHPTDSGFDLFANKDTVINPNTTVVIGTGVAVKLPPGYEAQVRPRSGVTSKTKLRVQLGTIDNAYVGEVGIIVDNISRDRSIDSMTKYYQTLEGKPIYNYGYSCFKGSYKILKGDKLAQLVVVPIHPVEAYEVDKLPNTERGNNGFGSTGY